MADKKNLCAQIDIALHNRVTEEKDRLEMTTSQYIAALLTEYYKMKDENGGINMTGSRTMAFQIPEELFQRIKTHLARETARTGVKLTQRDFVLGLIEQALAEAEASLAPQEAPESTEEAPEDSGAAGTTPGASEASTEAERDTADIEQYDDSDFMHYYSQWYQSEKPQLLCSEMNALVERTLADLREKSLTISEGIDD